MLKKSYKNKATASDNVKELAKSYQEGIMRRILRRVMAYLTIGVIIFAFGLFAFKMGDAKTTGEHAAGAEYSILRNALVSIQDQQELSDSLLRNRLLALYRGSEHLLAAQITDSNNNPIWRIPAESAYIVTAGSDKSLGIFSAPRWSTVSYQTPLTNGMTLYALYMTVSKSDVSEAVKTPLMIVAVWSLLLAVAAILLRKDENENAEIPAEQNQSAGPQNRQKNQKVAKNPPKPVRTSYVGVLPQVMEEDEEQEEQQEGQKEDEAQQDKVVVQEENVRQQVVDEQEVVEQGVLETSGVSQEEPQEAPEEQIEEEFEEPEKESDEISDQPAQLAAQTSAQLQTQPESQKDEDREQKPQVPENVSYEEGYAKLEEEVIEWSSRYQRKAPQAVPEIHTEFHTEEPEHEEEPAASSQRPERHDIRAFPMPLTLSDSLLEHRVTEELSKNEGVGELSLLLVHCEVAGPSDPLSTALAATIRDYFGTKDYIFELYRGAFAVILPGLDLGASLKLSEDLADVLSTTMSLYKDIEGEAPVFMGISSREGRKIDSFKLYREASTAIHKAFSDGNSKILAFRPKTA